MLGASGGGKEPFNFIAVGYGIHHAVARNLQSRCGTCHFHGGKKVFVLAYRHAYCRTEHIARSGSVLDIRVKGFDDMSLFVPQHQRATVSHRYDNRFNSFVRKFSCRLFCRIEIIHINACEL